MKSDTKKDLQKMKDINLDNLSSLCNLMFIARNITHDDALMQECLKTIDKLYRSPNTN
jgi:uncharacterized membrane protein YjjP (DUF1212 family)